MLGPSRSEGRFEARHARGLTPLVGREHELGLLLDRWQQAKEGDGQVVLLSGEAGIGKSRLVRACASGSRTSLVRRSAIFVRRSTRPVPCTW